MDMFLFEDVTVFSWFPNFATTYANVLENVITNSVFRRLSGALRTEKSTFVQCAFPSIPIRITSIFYIPWKLALSFVIVDDRSVQHCLPGTVLWSGAASPHMEPGILVSKIAHSCMGMP